MKCSGIGSQAAIERIMMEDKDDYATTIRKPDGEIEVQKDRYVSMAEKVKFFSLPFVGGTFSLADSLILGMKTLTFPASFFGDDEDDLGPSKFELFLNRLFEEKLEKVLVGVAMAFSAIPAVGIFMVPPLFISNIFRGFITSDTLMASLEGVIHIVISVVYIKFISRMEDIRRTLMYHSVEHKCINCIEYDLDLTVDNMRANSKQHKRCGTSFLAVVMVISVLLFMVIRMDDFWLKALNRIVLIPVIAGVSYEFLRLAGRGDTWLMNVLSRPGTRMQDLTVKEPDNSTIGVTIEAVDVVFDWKKYLKENFLERESSSDSDVTAAAG